MHWTIIAGTNRSNSRSFLLSQFLQKELSALTPEKDQIQLLDLKNLPTEIFSPEVYEKKPKSFDEFQKCISKTDAILSVLPEYNGSAPGAYKYFIDMLSFPESLSGKPAAFVGLSAGKFGGVRAVEQMQQVFLYRKAYLFSESLFIRDAESHIHSDGSIVDSFLKTLCDQLLKGFVDFANRLKA